MPLCYTFEQLWRLRSSPLVCKPENFPPLEEWMGPPQEQKQKSLAPPRGRLDDPTIQSEQSQKRPTLLDTHHISKKSSTAPEDIILGPPKTAFASANSRNSFKSPSVDASDEASASNKRFSLQERPPKDRDLPDGEKREGRFNGIGNRRLGRDDREDWQNSRHRRHHEQEEGDVRPKRNGERDKPRWDKEAREQELGADAKRLSRDGARRDGRGKFDQPWFRGDKTQEGGDEATKAQTKSSEWRRERTSGRGPEWDRPLKPEKDPEWMDPIASNEPRQAHTQEEFQRWKESMKAGAEGQDRISEKQKPVEQPEIKKLEPPPMPAFLEVSDVESGMDKFFASYGDRKTSSEQKPAEVKAHRKPRFAALFSPQPEGGPKGPSYVESTDMAQRSDITPPQAAAAPMDANKVDQEHFQRVLQMLAGRSNNNTPQSGSATKPPKDTHDREEMGQSQSPLVELLQKRDQAPGQEDRSRDRGTAGIHELLGRRPTEPQQRAPREPTPSRDADILLRLMQQARVGQDSKPTQASNPEASASTAEPSQVPRGGSRRLPVERSNNNLPTLFDDPAISQMQGQPPQGENLQRRPTHGQLPGYFDEPFSNNPRQANQQPMSKSEPGTQPRAPTLPLGMQRPPGFDPMTVPPPAWQRPPPQPGPLNNGMNPPPGISNESARAMNAAYASHVMQQTPHQQMPPAPPQQQRQRKYTGGDGVPGYPLGMGPPPGFMNAPPPPPPPPPGFPNLPPIRGGGGGLPRQQQFPDGNGMLPRHLMDMLASGQRGDGREGGGSGGGVGMGGNFR